MPDKTVFILGAGFSYPRGVPTQNQLLEFICHPGMPHHYFTESRISLIEYIEKVYGLKGDQINRLQLEDVYTPLHQAISRGEALKGYRTDDLREIERCLNLLVADMINRIPIIHRKNDEFQHHQNEYLQQFARRLIRQKRKAPTSDRFSIISLNWDVHLDSILHQMMQVGTKENPKGWMDYGCHCTAFEGGKFLPPPILARERKAYTIMMLKLHGSFNWRYCPQCDKLFVQTDVSNGVTAFKDVLECPKCGLLGLDYSILLPTFRKDLSRFHFQHVWNQAAVELAEANRLVFIGYSFPLADFDFRSLITKCVGDVEVDVVLYDEKKPDRKTDTWEGKQYRNYFGDKISSISYRGVVDWIANHMDEVLP